MESPDGFADTRTRWYHGLYAGLAGGALSLAIFWLAGAFWVRDIPLDVWARLVASTVLGTRESLPSGMFVAIGIGLHFVAAAICGIAYAAIARRVPVLATTPVSAFSGLVYGALVWYALANGIVPATGTANIIPLWEGLLASIVGFGFVISEIVTVLRPREPAT